MPQLRFDFPDPDRTGPAFFRDPVRVVRADTPHEVIPALTTVQEAVGSGLHAAGFIGYEAAPAFDTVMTVRAGGSLPLVWFGLFEEPHAEPAYQVGPGNGQLMGRPSAGGHATSIPWRLDISRDEHAAAVRTIHDAIAEGRTYQVNLTARLGAPFDGDAGALYQRLRRAQGGGYHALFDLGRHVIVSASPELFFEAGGRTITTRPMKGTRPRGRSTEEDRALADELRASPKDRAENLMIVDLLRNDLGRVCVAGHVRVPTLWAVERYRTVWQMTSTVTGRLRDDVGLVDILRALFPCGSVTGAPKISTMAIIAGLERTPREVYCGAIGWIRPGGDCTFSVPIRTAWIDRDRDRITYGAGGGVVWDSTAEGEYEELVAKTVVARDPWPSFRLLETLAVENRRPVRLERHLRRMAASAERFGSPFPEDDVRAAIERAGGQPGRFLVRVTLGADGTVEAEPRPLDPVGAREPDAGGPGASRLVVPARSPVDPSDPFLYHKTTHRAVYDRHLAEAPEGAFDVLLWNERGDITEFCRGNVVAEIDGRRLTPPAAAGLLPGCFRAQLLEEGRITEETLTLNDVTRASGLWFINSARGCIRVRLDL